MNYFADSYVGDNNKSFPDVSETSNFLQALEPDNALFYSICSIILIFCLLY